MPRRLTLEQVRERFSRYGFTILDKNFVYRNAKQQVRVRDDITNRIEDVTIDALQKRINRGRVVEVDPFLHALHRTDTLTLTTPGRTRSSRWKREIRHFAQTQLPQFLDEDRHVQRQAIRIANSFHAIVSRGENITIQRTHDGDTDRANLYAFINTLYKVAELHQKPKFRNMWVVVAIRANGLDSYRHINDNTIALLQDLIQHIYFGESLDVITDSSSAVLFSLVDWESMSIEFVNSRLIKHNPLDGPHVAGDLEGSEFVDGDAVGSREAGGEGEDELAPAALPRRRRNVGSLWRYINKTDVDLSRYGIFNKFESTNYRYSCFVYALQQSGKFTPEEIDLINDSINTRAFPCDTIVEVCKLYDCSITVEKVKHNINGRSKHIKTANYGEKSAARHINLILRDTHYMLNEPVPVTEYYLANMTRIRSSPRVNQSRRFECRNLTDKSVNYKKDVKTPLNKFLDMMFKHQLFRRFSSYQSFRVLNHNKHYDFTQLDYAPKCVRNVNTLAPPDAFYRDATAMDAAPTAPLTASTRQALPSHTLIFTNNINSFLRGAQHGVFSLPHNRISKHKGSVTKITFDYNTVVRNAKSTFMFEPTTDEIHMLHDLLMNRFGIDFYAYDTLAKIGEALMYSYHCYDDVPQLAGKPAVFIKQCAPKICIQAAFRKPVYAEGSLVQIDRNGSYTATYTEFAGIPKGVPKVINPEEWNEIKQSATYYYILIDVHSASSKHPEDRFEVITVGNVFIDKNMFEFVTQHYDIDYSFVSGYYFDSGFNSNIKRLSHDLWKLRQQLKSKGYRIESCIKTILSSLWGKAQSKRRITKDFVVKRDKMEDFIAYNETFLHKSAPIADDITIFSLLNPVTLHYIRPQFSTNVLSHSRTTLNNIFYRAADNNIPIYYSNTDSLVLNTSDLNKLNKLFGDNLLGNDLGQFKRERENICSFICLSPKKYIQRTVGDVDTKVVGLRNKNEHSLDDIEKMYKEWFSLA